MSNNRYVSKNFIDPMLSPILSSIVLLSLSVSSACSYYEDPAIEPNPKQVVESTPLPPSEYTNNPFVQSNPTPAPEANPADNTATDNTASQAVPPADPATNATSNTAENAPQNVEATKPSSEKAPAPH